MAPLAAVMLWPSLGVGPCPVDPSGSVVHAFLPAAIKDDSPRTQYKRYRGYAENAFFPTPPE
eukprot:633734-Rhodomonas_salina.2